MIPDDKALKMKTIGEMVAGIDLIRSGKSLDDVTEEDFRHLQNEGKSDEVKKEKETETVENIETKESIETPESVETQEVAAEGK